jgi:hypothetical protein
MRIGLNRFVTYMITVSMLSLILIVGAIACQPRPPIISQFSASPAEIKQGEPTTLKWTIQDAVSVTIDQGVGKVGATGTLELSPDKTIAYTLTAQNAGGTVTKSVVVSVTATPPPPVDTTPPVIESISASSETETGAFIAWTTNEPSSSEVDYGQTIQYGMTLSSDQLTGTHSFTLSGLQAGATYHYRVKSKDKAGNETTSADDTFATTEMSRYRLELQSLEWGRKSDDVSYEGLPTVYGKEYLYIKGTVRNISGGTVRGIISTMDCWSGKTMVKYAVFVYRSPALPGQVFSFDIQTPDDPKVDNVTVEFSDSMGKSIEVIKKY